MKTDQKNDFLSFLKNRLEIAEAYTKDFIDDSKRSIDDYNFAKTQDAFVAIDSDKLALSANRRYNQTLPVIFSYVEALKAAVFDRFLDVVIKQRGKNDEEKAKKIEAVYSYLKDKLRLEDFQIQAFEWFALLGFVSAHTSFKTEYYETPYTNEETGQPEVDEQGNPINIPVYTYNDPVVNLNKYDKIVFSPDSEFKDSFNVDIPYYIIKDILTEDEVKNIYNKKVEADIEIKQDLSEEFKNNEDLKRVGVYLYYGTIPSEYKDKVKNWDIDNVYFIAFSKKKILSNPELKDSPACSFGKFYGLPDSFFGYGFGKTGRYFQQEKSIRRGQQVRLADLAAYPKWLIKDDGTTDIDLHALFDPRALAPVRYKGEKPESSTPPNISDLVNSGEEKSNMDAQQVFGILDLVAASQEGSTSSTATGQSIFADASNKRIKLVKRKFANFYLQVVKNLFKLCAENWEEDRIVTLTDEEGNVEEMTLNKESLSDIDFDNDLVIDIESQVANKDIQKAQNIEFYNTSKNDPLINRKEVIKKLMKENYDVQDVDKFLSTPSLPPGTMLTDQNGQQYTIDESGQIVPAQAQETTAQPTGTPNIPSSPSGLMGGTQNVGT